MELGIIVFALLFIFWTKRATHRPRRYRRRR